MSPAAARGEAAQERLRELDSIGASRRLWEKDASLWKQGPVPPELVDRLGWLPLPETMLPRAPEFKSLAGRLLAEGVRDVVLLGMGGSSLCPELLAKVFGSAAGFPRLRVLDTTAPGAVLAARRSLKLENAVFVVASKSGSTIETACLLEYFFAEARSSLKDRAGSRFIAITDPGTPFERQAVEQGFGSVVLSPSDVGGRYSALTPFGLLPAALLGLDPARLLEPARRMARACGPDRKPSENPGFQLGAWIGEGALTGKDKLTLILPPPLASFGAWLEQLVAESTGKEGKGILPVEGEELLAPDAYGKDRLFVQLRLKGSPDAAQDRAAAALAAAGHELLAFELDSPFDLGAEFFRWEIAVAAASMILQINPFDQPNVQESKDLTRKILEGGLPSPARAASAESAAETVLGLERALRPGDYLGITAFLEGTRAEQAELAALRRRLQKRGNATTVGFGPRFLHSTGQLHKGGPDRGVFLQLTASPAEDVPIPGKPYSFGALQRAQADGDLGALSRRGRRVARVELGDHPAQSLDALNRALS